MIKIEKLSKSYGRQQVLNELTFTFERGKVYGVVGKNGAGKTTLFHCMAGMERYDGSIQSDKVPLKNHLGLLFTSPYFFDYMTGKEYIHLLLNARKIDKKDIDSQNIFDLPLGQYASSYSTGMKKKLALTAIMMQQNDYFIFDEPFNGVDIQGNLVISSIIKRLKELNKVIILSSHIFSALSDVCDDIILLEKGCFSKHVKKEEFGSLEEDMLEEMELSLVNKLDLT